MRWPPAPGSGFARRGSAEGRCGSTGVRRSSIPLPPVRPPNPEEAISNARARVVKLEAALAAVGEMDPLYNNNNNFRSHFGSSHFCSNVVLFARTTSFSFVSFAHVKTWCHAVQRLVGGAGRMEALKVAKSQATILPIQDRINACKAHLERARKRVARADAVRMLDFGQFDFGQFDFGQLAEIELAEVEINWPKSNRWCLLCFFSLSFFFLLLCFHFSELFSCFLSLHFVSVLFLFSSPKT